MSPETALAGGEGGVKARPDSLLVAAAVTGLLTVGALVVPVPAADGSSWDGPPDPSSCSGGKG